LHALERRQVPVNRRGDVSDVLDLAMVRVGVPVADGSDHETSRNGARDIDRTCSMKVIVS